MNPAQTEALKRYKIECPRDLVRVAIRETHGDATSVSIDELYSFCNSKLKRYIITIRDLRNAEGVRLSGQNPNTRVSVVEEEEEEDDDYLPPEWFCPITTDVMHDPVLLSDGHTYERRAIEDWLRESNTSPMTGVALVTGNVYPNMALKGWITRLMG